MTDGFVHQTEAQMTMTIRTMLLRLLFLLIVVAAEGQTCSVSPSTERDPRLVEMTYDVGDGEQTTMVYVDPPVTELYQGEPPASTKVVPKFNGLWGKFVNMSNKPITLYWESSPGGQKHEMRHQKPFSPASTATFPTHRFLICEEGQPDKVLKLFVVGDYPENIYFYDPYFVEGDPEATEKNLQVLTADERYRYDGWRKTMLFNEQYKAKTGRSYLANYLRKPPIHYIWPADYFGQEHWVTTKETHIVELPPEKELSPVLGLEPKTRQLTAESPRTLAAYRDPSQSTLNMTLKVLSIAPRVFEIENFLSDVEVAHILQLAAGIDLSLSSTGEQAAGEKKVRDDRRTRTSYNSWVPREKSPVIDIVYRRAADLLRMDEALFRFRAPDEIPELKTKKTIAEQLQLVVRRVNGSVIGLDCEVLF